MSCIDFLSICAIANSYRNGVLIDKINFAICGDLSTAAVLTCLVYWFSPSKQDGQLRTKLRKGGKVWLARQNKEWLEECCVTEEQIRTVIKRLTALGLVEVQAFMFNGFRTNHWHLNIEKYTELYNEEVQKKITVSAKTPDRSVPKARTHNNTLKQYTYEENKVVPQKNILSEECSGTREQRALLEKEDCFESEKTTFEWLNRLGFKRSVVTRIMGEYSFYQLDASREYLLEQLLGGFEIKSSITGYFLKILENEWWLPNSE